MAKILLQPEKYYHLYNRANGSDNLFVNKGNYEFFLQRYQSHISPIAETLAYCLMPNHFHLVIKIRTEAELKKQDEEKKHKKALAGNAVKSTSDKEVAFDSSRFISQQFSNLFTSYAQAFNKQQGRHGSLFSPNFERKEINSDQYLRQSILYVHLNPVHHKFVHVVSSWEHSSYNGIVSRKSELVKANEVIDLFEDLDNFRDLHSDFQSHANLDIERFFL